MYTEKNRAVQLLMFMVFCLNKPEKWCQNKGSFPEANTLDEIFSMVGNSEEEETLRNCPNTDEAYPFNLSRDEISSVLWFVRQALKQIAPEFKGMVRKWHDMPGRTYNEVLQLVASAFDLAKIELNEMPDLFGEGPDRPMIVLHRWADIEGNKLCAMSAISKKLGNFPSFGG